MPWASMLWKKRVNCWRSLVEAVVMLVTSFTPRKKRQHAANLGDACVHVFLF